MCVAHPYLEDEIGRLPMFAGLEPAVLAGIAHCACCLALDKEERIFWQGETPQAYYHVLSGHLRQAITSPKGDEWVIDIVAAGRHCGLPELFSGEPYLSFAEAVEPATVLRIGRDGLLRAIAGDSALAMRVLNAVAQHQTRFARDVAACFFHPGSRRVLDYLVREAGTGLRPGADNVVELPVSKRLVAARIGMTAESLSRALRKLSDAGLIRVRGREIVLLDKLAALRNLDELVDAEPADLPRRRGELRLVRGRRAEAGRSLQGA